MAKKKTIDGVTYYPKKRHEDGYCQKCGLFLTELSSVYRKGSEDSSELICAKCVNDMFVEKQRDNDRSIVEYPVEELLKARYILRILLLHFLLCRFLY